MFSLGPQSCRISEPWQIDHAGSAQRNGQMSVEPRGGDFGGGRAPSRNVFGGRLEPCSTSPMTGFFRNGCCDTGPEDGGSHTVCVVMTEEFLRFSKAQGNDLSTPLPRFGFPGLKPGDRWCLCAPRWKEALDAGQAPRVVLRATHEGALDYCTLDELKRHAIDLA
jgi:uncharacterized protein (DUF2237 family)